MKRTLLAFCCSLILVAFAGSAGAADALSGYEKPKDPPPPKTCPDDEKFYDTEKCKNNKNIKVIVRHTVKYEEENGRCKREEKKEIVACKHKKSGKRIPLDKCKKRCFKDDDRGGGKGDGGYDD